ncbi:unnamed protein product [Adineta steineri]|uniref:Uncharacterized protein n=1 Tax=Adineta steineri TaxID=433720 RepID=A0A814HUJ0_9BILA|nr:unnamed protein product [Adineta steineri]CAF0869773.1 unnamed protein product [Adineta steineri]CAF1015173.1 unnamed protein product [Adineta steineri]
MIPQAAFHEFLAKTLRKITVFGRNPVGKCQEFGPGIVSMPDCSTWQTLLSLLDSVYLITSDRLETRRFNADELYLTLQFFNFISKQLIIYYRDRWFSKMKNSTQSPTSLFVDNTNNCRSSYVSQCRQNYSKPLIHILVFEGTTSLIYFDIELFEEMDSLSSSSNNID